LAFNFSHQAKGRTMKPEPPTLLEGELKHVERLLDDLPKVPVSKAAHDRLLDLRRCCRKALGGFRLYIALVASALIEHGAGGDDAAAIVARYFQATAQVTTRCPRALTQLSAPVPQVLPRSDALLAQRFVPSNAPSSALRESWVNDFRCEMPTGTTIDAKSRCSGGKQ
jgi:hypothetical protein